jgi:hypothetical protein
MDPIYIILFAVVVTLVLTLAFPRLRSVSPALRRVLWIAVIIGGIALLIVIYLIWMR